MKSLLFSIILFGFTNVWADDTSDMKAFAEKAGDYISTTRDYDGYSVKKLRGKPLMKKSFRTYLAEREKKAKKRFIDFVNNTPEEFEGSAYKAKRNPKKYLQTPYLFQPCVVRSVFVLAGRRHGR